MAEPAVAVVSVRAHARRAVAPDQATVAGAMTVTRDSSADALRVAAAVQQALEADLSGLGAVPLTAESERAGLTWSIPSVTTQDEYDEDPKTRRHGPTGRVTATVSAVIAVREMDQFDRLAEVLAGHETLKIHHVGWYVDPDNPAWPAVRAEAIHAAIAKGRDYATALGGELVGVEQIADVGLLGGDAGARADQWIEQRAVGLGFSGSHDSGAPSLSPVPQELTATIDARFLASLAALGDL